MSEDQFTKLFKYMDERFGAVDAQIMGVKDEVNQVRNVLDGVVGDIHDIKIEMAAMNVKLDRHDQAIGQLADRTGVQLQYR